MKARRLQELCPRCGRGFYRLATHLAQSPECKELADALAAEENEPADEPNENFFDAFLEDSAACEVADGLASLKYERGFQRPDIEAAKAFAGVVGKRTRDNAFPSLQGLLQPGVDRRAFDAGALPAAESHLRKWSIGRSEWVVGGGRCPIFEPAAPTGHTAAGRRQDLR